jgi:predicted transcriptional regulator
MKTRRPRQRSSADINISNEEDIFKLGPFELLKRFLNVMTDKKFEIFKLICEKPGISISEIQRELQLPKSTVSSTVSTFKRMGFVRTNLYIDPDSKRVKVRVYPDPDTLALITKELEILYLRAKKTRMKE